MTRRLLQGQVHRHGFWRQGLRHVLEEVKNQRTLDQDFVYYEKGPEAEMIEMDHQGT